MVYLITGTTYFRVICRTKRVSTPTSILLPNWGSSAIGNILPRLVRCRSAWFRLVNIYFNRVMGNERLKTSRSPVGYGTAKRDLHAGTVVLSRRYRFLLGHRPVLHSELGWGLRRPTLGEVVSAQGITGHRTAGQTWSEPRPGQGTLCRREAAWRLSLGFRQGVDQIRGGLRRRTAVLGTRTAAGRPRLRCRQTR